MITSSSNATLTAAQQQVVSAVAAGPTGAVLPEQLKGKAAAKLVAALVEKGLLREVRAKADLPVWREDTQTGRRYSLVLTKAGHAAALQAIKPSPDRPAEDIGATAPKGDAAKPALLPRSESKLAEVIALLRRDQGSSVADLMTATGWLRHTTRAVLTGLRKRGYALLREAGATGAVYRIAETAPAVTA